MILARPEPPKGGSSPEGLFQIAALFHLSFRELLSVLKGLIDCDLARESSGELLTDGSTQSLKFGDSHELNADIGNGLDGRLCRIGGIDRFERHLGERRRSLVFGIGIKRFAGAGRNIGPTFLRGDKLEIALAGSPSDEFFGIFLLCRTGGYSQRPRP